MSVLALSFGAGGLLVAVPAQTALADTKQEIAAVKQDIADADVQLTDLEDKAEQASELYNQARVQLLDVTRRLAVAQAKVEREQTALAVKQQQVDAFVVAAYQGGGVADFSAFVSGASAQDTIDRLDSLGLVARNQDSAMADLELAKHAAAEAAVEAQQILDEQTQVTARVADDKAAIAASVDAQVAILDSLSAKENRLVRKAKVEAERAAARKAAAELARRKAALKAAAEALARQQAQDEAAAAARAKARAAAAAAAAEASNNDNGGSGNGGSGNGGSGNGGSGNGGSGDGDTQPDPSANGSNGAEIAVKWAYSELGKTYVWGANGPNTFDCSGLTSYVWAKAGVYLAHFTGDQWNSGRHIPYSELRPGDLVFFHSDHHHVGIYVGNGQMINAPHTGDVVRIAPIWSNFSGAVRVG